MRPELERFKLGAASALASSSPGAPLASAMSHLSNPRTASSKKQGAHRRIWGPTTGIVHPAHSVPPSQAMHACAGCIVRRCSRGPWVNPELRPVQLLTGCLAMEQRCDDMWRGW